MKKQTTKTGDVFWKVAFCATGSHEWELSRKVYRHPKHALDVLEIDRLTSFNRGRRKVVKCWLVCNL